jgi:hypothetical protein
VKALVISQPFDGHDLFSLGLHRQDGAGVNIYAIHEHRAGTAAAVIAGSLRAGEVQAISENIIERPVRINFDRVDITVDLQGNLVGLLGLHFSAFSPCGL